MQVQSGSDARGLLIILNYDSAVLEGFVRKKSLLNEDITAKLEEHSHFQIELRSYWQMVNRQDQMPHSGELHLMPFCNTPQYGKS